jgi:uncharacterized protein YdhG (YjbR/CyaY superfamily)
MKKANSSNRGSASKKRVAPRNMDEYLAGVPEPARSTLKKVRGAIRSAVPAEATECISYGMPAFKHKGVLVWFAAFSDHCSLFPTASVIEAFKKVQPSMTVTYGGGGSGKKQVAIVAMARKLAKGRECQIRIPGRWAQPRSIRPSSGRSCGTNTPHPFEWEIM